MTSLVPRLPARVWALESGSLVAALGLGLVLPFQLIYLHAVRGMSLGTGGLETSKNGGGCTSMPGMLPPLPLLPPAELVPPDPGELPPTLELVSPPVSP